MRKAIKVIINWKTYIFQEPLVWDYLLLEKDLETFLNNLFDWKIPNLDEEKIQHLIQVLFFDEDDLLSKIIPKQEKIKLHVLLAKLVKFFWNTFSDWLNMPWSLFLDILKDFDQITEEKGGKTSWVAKSANDLKSLLSK